MPSIKRILVPIDWSKPAIFAFQLAASLARNHNAQLDVLHVVPISVMANGPLPDSYYDHLREELGRFRPSDTKNAVQHLIAEGVPATEILRIAKETNCDLIVMGTHGRKGVNRLFLGSVAEEVLRKAPCPVMTVKSGVSPGLTGTTSQNLVAKE